MTITNNSIFNMLDGYINENYIYEKYSLEHVGEKYNSDDNISFNVFDDKEIIASIKIFKIDGAVVDAVEDTYNYDDVYADIILHIIGKEDKYDVDNIKKWVFGKLNSMGFNKNPAILDGEKYNVSEYKDLNYESVQSIDNGRFSLKNIDDLDKKIESKNKHVNLKSKYH